jgi:small basic protein (TIGR04137 family)
MKTLFSPAYSIKMIFRRRTMTMHPSLKNAAKMEIQRNVLKRFERVDKLTEEGRWKEGDRGFALPKTKPE